MLGYAGFVAQLPLLRAELGLSTAEAGWVSGAFYAGYTVAVALLVSLTDAIGARRIYLASALTSGIGAATFALFARGFWTASAAQIAMGVGLAGTYMPGLRLLSDNVEGRAQGRAVSLYTGCYALGTSASFLFIGQVTRRLGWRCSFGLAALGPVIALVTVAIMFPASSYTVSSPPSWRQLVRSWAEVLRSRPIMARAITYAAHNFELFGLWSWAVSFLTFVYRRNPAVTHADPTFVASFLTLLLLPASLLGNEVAGRIGNRRWVILAMFVSAGCALLVGLAPQMVPTWMMLLLLPLYGFVAAAESGALTSGVVARARPESRGATMAVYSMVGFGGAVAGPLVFGVILNAVGADIPAAWAMAFAVMGLGALVGPLALAVLDRGVK